LVQKFNRLFPYALHSFRKNPWLSWRKLSTIWQANKLEKFSLEVASITLGLVLVFRLIYFSGRVFLWPRCRKRIPQVCFHFQTKNEDFSNVSLNFYLQTWLRYDQNEQPRQISITEQQPHTHTGPTALPGPKNCWLQAKITFSVQIIMCAILSSIYAVLWYSRCLSVYTERLNDERSIVLRRRTVWTPPECMDPANASHIGICFSFPAMATLVLLIYAIEKFILGRIAACIEQMRPIAILLQTKSSVCVSVCMLVTTHDCTPCENG